ncbi:MAG: Stp1/IreP family PP2C-type Ser/Thr phosphatase [Gammaproteobacteria bacterium]|nr:Stp1/IreP family PP2C-type Ser/Thr phosphatase [Gammaproteobacteria bacterium]
MIKLFGKSDTGLQRDHNEDLIGWSEKDGLVVLADGMGGHNAGEVASEIAVSTIQQQLSNRGQGDAVELIQNAVSLANEVIHQRAKESLVCAGMGTTIVVALFDETQITIGHVGDSRLYRLRDGILQQLTSDHSLVQELVDEGFMNEAEAHESVSKNVITRALGTASNVECDIQQQEISTGDLYLLCSDGLSDMLEANEILKLISAETALDQRVENLVVQANQHGGSDNISAILVEIN